MDVRNTGGNKYETTAREIQNYQFSTFFSRSKMTSRKVTATALKVNVKKFRPTSTSSLACVLTNLDAFCPMEVHLPGEKSILPYFSSPRGVAILDCDSHSQAGSTRRKVRPIHLHAQTKSAEFGFVANVQVEKLPN